MPGIGPRKRRSSALEVIASLDKALTAYHGFHEQRWGPILSCQETVCVEGKWALAWLREQAEGDHKTQFRGSGIAVGKSPSRK